MRQKERLERRHRHPGRVRGRSRDVRGTGKGAQSARHRPPGEGIRGGGQIANLQIDQMTESASQKRLKLICSPQRAKGGRFGRGGRPGPLGSNTAAGELRGAKMGQDGVKIVQDASWKRLE